MNQRAKVIFKFTGYIFTVVPAILFYNHLLVASTNPGFQVMVYFDYYGEGLIELIIFLSIIPFMINSFALEIMAVKQINRR